MNDLLAECRRLHNARHHNTRHLVQEQSDFFCCCFFFPLFCFASLQLQWNSMRKKCHTMKSCHFHLEIICKTLALYSHTAALTAHNCQRCVPKLIGQHSKSSAPPVIDWLLASAHWRCPTKRFIQLNRAHRVQLFRTHLPSIGEYNKCHGEWRVRQLFVAAEIFMGPTEIWRIPFWQTWSPLRWQFKAINKFRWKHDRCTRARIE